MTKHNKKFLIKSSSPFKLKWDLFIILLAIYNSLGIPLERAFQPDVSLKFLRF